MGDFSTLKGLFGRGEENENEEKKRKIFKLKKKDEDVKPILIFENFLSFSLFFYPNKP